MADNYEGEPGDSSGQNINRVDDGARAEQRSAQQPSANLEQRFGRGVCKGDTPDTVEIFYYFAGPTPMAVDGRAQRAWMRALESTN